MTGKVYLVGAGPGRHSLITLRGLELIRECQVLLYDRLAGNSFLCDTGPDCERIYVGKQAGRHSMSQDEINSLIIDMAEKGRKVVRLKGGDPFVFGRGGEEAEALMAAGIPFEIVPGVSSAVAVPELSGIPVTHREASRSFHVITAHSAGDTGKYLTDQIRSLAGVEGTLVFLMGLSHLEDICRELLEARASGIPEGRRFYEDTPAAVIQGDFWGGQRTVRGTLGNIAQRVAEAGLGPPAVILVGDTAAMKLTNPLPGSLSGCKIGMVGTGSFIERLESRLSGQGAICTCLQRMQVLPRKGQEGLFERIEKYTWIVFTSANGVRIFFDNMARCRKDIRILGGIGLACVGSGTAAALLALGLRPDYMPEDYDTHSLGTGLARLLTDKRPGPGHQGHRVLLYRASEADSFLSEILQEAGISTEDYAAYDLKALEAEGIETLGGLDYVAFGSAAGARAFREGMPGLWEELASGGRALAIGSRTAAALAAGGCRIIITAGESDTDGMAQALIQDWKECGGRCGE